MRMDDIIFIVPDAPFTLPVFLDWLLFNVGYCLYLILLQVTGRHILFSSEAVFLMIVGAIAAYVAISISRDLRFISDASKK